MIYFKIKKRGFTLVELMVAIAIIGVLTAIVTVAFGVAQKHARDANRKIDLKDIGFALARYKAQYGTYPPSKPQTSCGGTDSWAESNGSCGGQWLTTDANFYTFMPKVPIDPVNTGANAGWGDGNYVYSYSPSQWTAQGYQDYELVAQLETVGDKDSCGQTPAYYHNLTPNVPWCPPWPSNLGRSQNIISDH